MVRAVIIVLRLWLRYRKDNKNGKPDLWRGRTRPGSQCNDFAEHLGQHVGTDARLGHDVVLAPEEVFEVLLDGHEIEEAAAWLQVDQEVEVAVFARLTARDRAEDAHAPCAV